MRLSRRRLLGAALGATQLGLVSSLVRPRRARAQSADGPSRLLTIYLSGGYNPQYLFCPLAAAEIPRHIPTPHESGGERVFFLPEDVIDIGTNADGYSPLRMARTWDPSRPGNRDTNPPPGGPRWLPLGYSWIEHGLAPYTAVVHGVDMGTASHQSGYIAAMCGVAGSEYRAPALQSVVANHFYDAYADARPLPCVALDSRGVPNAFTLPSRAAASFVPNIATVRQTLSDRGDDVAGGHRRWNGLNTRTPADDVDFLGNVIGTANSTPLERAVQRNLRRFRGRSTAGTDTYLQQLHDGLRGVSTALSRNLADVLEATAGVEHLTGNALFAGDAAYGDGPFGYHIGYANEYITDGEFLPSFDMALRLMKADLASSIHMYMPRFYFDHHAGKSGHEAEFLEMRGSFDVLARFLGEMKQTPLPNGKTLLDDTLVLIFSEFARTWISGSGDTFNYPDDHWPVTSVTFVGGGVAGNRMLGGFDVTDFSYGPRGKPVDVLEEGGQAATRPPRAADVTTTALRILGLEMGDFFIPGGYGEIVGVRQT